MKFYRNNGLVRGVAIVALASLATFGVGSVAYATGPDDETSTAVDTTAPTEVTIVTEEPAIDAPEEAPAISEEAPLGPVAIEEDTTSSLKALKVATDNTNDPAYWQNLYPNAVACYKYDGNGGEHGSVTNSGNAVTLGVYGASWPGDRWEVLIVKGGSVDYGDGPGNKVYELPVAGTAYFAPLNAGGQQAAVSHWIVCKGETPPFNWDWEYAAPTCTALTVTYPENIPAGQANDVNVKIVNLGAGGGEITLNFHNNGGTWSGTQSFTYADHPSWPGWTYYKGVWAQVAGTDYHWTGEVSCGNPPPSCPSVTNGPVATEINPAGWNYVGTRATGDHRYVPGAIVLETTDTANPGSSLNKSVLYRNNAEPMATFGEPSVVFGNGTGGKPGKQYGFDADGDGTIDAILVSEPWVPGYGDSWSVFNPPGSTAAQFVKDGAPHTGGGHGSQWYGSWNEWIEAFPNAKGANYLGLSLGGGVLGNWEIVSFTAGCTVYTFDTVKIEGTPTITVTPPTCLDPYNYINYDFPVGVSVNGFTGKGTIRAEDYPDARGDGSSIYGAWEVPVTVADGYTYTGPATLKYELTDPAKLDCEEEEVVKPSGSISYTCVTEGTKVNGLVKAGSSDTTFQLVVDGVVKDEKLVKAGEEYTLSTILAEDSSGGSADVQIKAGDLEITKVTAVSTNCVTPPSGGMNGGQDGAENAAGASQQSAIRAELSVGQILSISGLIVVLIALGFFVFRRRPEPKLNTAGE